MLKWYCLLLACILIGCGYTQPDLNERYGIIQPLGGIRILKVDQERVISLAGDYIIRVYPGQRHLLLGAGHNEKTFVEGTKSPFAKMTIDVEEGMCYYIEPKYTYGLNDLFFGAGFQEIKGWKPTLKKQAAIPGYQKKPPAAEASQSKEDVVPTPSIEPNATPANP